MIASWEGEGERKTERIDEHFRSHGRTSRVALVVVALSHEVVEVGDDVFELL